MKTPRLALLGLCCEHLKPVLMDAGLFSLADDRRCWCRHKQTLPCSVFLSLKEMPSNRNVTVDDVDEFFFSCCFFQTSAVCNQPVLF